VVGVGESARSVFAFDPAANRWHRRASLPAPRVGAQAVWTGRLLLLFAGQNSTATQTVRSGFAYDPRTNRWSTIAPAPLGVAGVSAVWTGHSLIVAGSRRSAAFTPAR